RLHLAGANTRVDERLLRRRDNAPPDVLGIVLHPTGPRVVLAHRAKAAPARPQLAVDDEARRATGALVDRKNHPASWNADRSPEAYRNRRGPVLGQARGTRRRSTRPRRAPMTLKIVSATPAFRRSPDHLHTPALAPVATTSGRGQRQRSLHPCGGYT